MWSCRTCASARPFDARVGAGVQGGMPRGLTICGEGHLGEIMLLAMVPRAILSQGSSASSRQLMLLHSATTLAALDRLRALHHRRIAIEMWTACARKIQEPSSYRMHTSWRLRNSLKSCIHTA
jgi:hypothetical protein